MHYIVHLSILHSKNYHMFFWEAWCFALTGVLLVFINSMPVNCGNNSLKATPMHTADYVK